MVRSKAKIQKSQAGEVLSQVAERLIDAGLGKQLDAGIYFMVNEETGKPGLAIACNMGAHAVTQIGAVLAGLLDQLEIVTAPSYVTEGKDGTVITISGPRAFLKFAEDLQRYALDLEDEDLLPGSSTQPDSKSWQ